MQRERESVVEQDLAGKHQTNTLPGRFGAVKRIEEVGRHRFRNRLTIVANKHLVVGQYHLYRLP